MWDFEGGVIAGKGGEATEGRWGSGSAELRGLLGIWELGLDSEVSWIKFGGFHF